MTPSNSKLQQDVIRLALVLLAVYTLWGLPFGSFLVVLGTGGMVHLLTNNLLVSLVAAILLGAVLNSDLQQRAIQRQTERAAQQLELLRAAEGFQTRDPASIADRIRTNRDGAPLRPKIASPTGVLESPDILDNVPLKPMQELTYDAQPGASIPASAKARVLIAPPPEGFVAAPKGSQDKPPKENIHLFNGEDHEGVETAMLVKGTDIPAPEVAANEMASFGPGSAPAF